VSRQDDVPTSVERADPLVGSIFDRRFHVDERIAAGGFGAIYRATHIKSGHRIALKVLLPSLAQDLGVVARFRREGDTLTTLRNPHTIIAYELGEAADRTLFIVMELLYGESLFERYKANGPLPWRRMAKIAREVCESLEEAHALGIVHRDLKPTNIHLEQQGDDRDYVKVLDFGIAKILGAGAADLTNAGQMIGTIDYMSPEQMLGGSVTGQTDIYTLGIVMYEMIAGCMPFGESLTAAQALSAVMKSKPQPLYLRAPVPEDLDRIVMRCLERETSRRYQTVRELRDDLERLLPKHDDEATQLTPPPEPLVRRPKRPSVEDTTFTPPPAKLIADARPPAWPVQATTAGVPSAQLLAQARRAKRPTADEATQLTPPPEPLLAKARRADRPADFEATQLTPPPPRLLREAAGSDWTDDDDHLPTSRRRKHDASDGRAPAHAPGDRHRADDHERVTAVARLADIVERAAMTRGPAGASVNERTTTIPRTSHDSEADLATARFPRGADAEVRARKPSSAPPPVPRTARAPTPQAPPTPPRTFTPQAPVPPRTFTPQTPLPNLVAAPFSQPPPARPTFGPDLFAVSPPPPALQSFDMQRIAAREALIRRLIWIAAIVVALGAGAILATQL